MFDYKKINGIGILRDKIPSSLQFWHCFGNILELNYSAKAIDEFYSDYTNKVTLLFTDENKQYQIELSLYNISGNLNFCMTNGFFSGFTIDEYQNSGNDIRVSLKTPGFENTATYFRAFSTMNYVKR